ncbi:hypothetical protein MA9V1_077 [Chryseobacterium phage MA9V-1]|nr:hypothetical protein MA9V1_077 [Chryseobacterium phage MA9V-1]
MTYSNVGMQINLSELYNGPDKFSDIIDCQGYQIYKITNIINGKSYIGDTKINLRWRFFNFWNGCSHFDLYANKSKNIHLYAAMRKYGLENFTLEILPPINGIAYTEFDEESYIVKFDTFNAGYNNTHNGKGKWGSGVSRKGKIYVHKDGNVITIKPDKLEHHINLGYSKGRGIGYVKDLIPVHKDGKNRRICKTLLNSFISNGWQRGIILSEHGKLKVRENSLKIIAKQRALKVGFLT